MIRAILTYLPSKKFLITLGVLLLLIGAGWFFFFAPRDASYRRSAGDTVAALEQQKAALNKDSDGDGLKDWEEALWKTDPHKADTDGDGTNDGEEVRQGRNPLVAGPHDLLASATSTPVSYDTSDSTASSSRPSVMNNIAANFARLYFAEKASATGKINIGNLATSVFSNLQGSVVQSARAAANENKYLAADFRMALGDGQMETRTYINTIASILLADDGSGTTTTESVVMQRAFQSEDPSLFHDLLPHEVRYRTFAQKLVAVPVPQHLYATHSAMVNSFWRLSVALQQLRNFDADSATGLSGLLLYSLEVQRSTTVLQSIMNEVEKQQFHFTTSEPGSLFDKYLSPTDASAGPQ